MISDRKFRKLAAREWSLCEERGDFFSRAFGLPASLWITKSFLRLGLNENHASLAMLVIGLIGAAFLMFGSWGILVGSAFLLLHHIFDYVDGQIARHHGRASVKGAVLDRWNHFIVETATFTCLAAGLFMQTNQMWAWIAVWTLYIWNRFRVLLAQLPANIMSEELSKYPKLERDMMRSNLITNQTIDSGNSPVDDSSDEQTNVSSFRSLISKARVASTSYNGFTILIGIGALIDLILFHLFSVDGFWALFVLMLAAYSIFNIIDYSLTYLRTEKVSEEINERIERSAKAK